jgi:hypothetical protein
MSVHGEFHRALRTLCHRLSESEFLIGEGWLARLEAVQAEANRDLSAAARTSIALLGGLESDLGDASRRADRSPAAPESLPSLELLRDACHHLRAHCCAILGVGPEGG